MKTVYVIILVLFTSFITTQTRADITIGLPTVNSGAQYNETTNTFKTCINETAIFSFVAHSSLGETLNINNVTTNLDATFGAGNWTTFINSNPPFALDSVQVFVQVLITPPTSDHNGVYSNANIGLMSASDSETMHFNFVSPTLILTTQNQVTCTAVNQSFNLLAESNSNNIGYSSFAWTQISGPVSMLTNNNSSNASVVIPIVNQKDSMQYQCVGTTDPDPISGVFCTVTDTITVYINPPASSSIDTHSACQSFLWIDGETYTESTNRVTHTVQNSNGCDSIITLNLTITNGVSGIDTHSTSDSLVWIDGKTYKSNNNTATHTLVNGASNGCDSLITLNLNIISDCQLASTRNSFEWIRKVEIGDDFTNSSGRNGSGYGNYLDNNILVNPSETVSISLTPGYKKRAYVEYWLVWADWNNDGDFDDDGEQILREKGKNTIIGSFTVPGNVSSGEIRLRIAMRWKKYAPSCGSFRGGEVEEYTITVGGLE
ncbi:MAG: GEVED domain-containing protein [Flavobacteriales bacterium]